MIAGRVRVLSLAAVPCASVSGVVWVGAGGVSGRFPFEKQQARLALLTGEGGRDRELSHFDLPGRWGALACGHLGSSIASLYRESQPRRRFHSSPAAPTVTGDAECGVGSGACRMSDCL
jgi:hypothetical protein